MYIDVLEKCATFLDHPVLLHVIIFYFNTAWPVATNSASSLKLQIIQLASSRFFIVRFFRVFSSKHKNMFYVFFEFQNQCFYNYASAPYMSLRISRH